MKYLAWVLLVVICFIISFTMFLRTIYQEPVLKKQEVKKEMFNDIEKWNNKCLKIGGEPLFYIDEINYVKVCISDEKIKLQELCSNERGNFSKYVDVKENKTDYVCRKEMYLKKLEDTSIDKKPKIKI